MPDDHSKSVPPLPIPNRSVKRLCADDSAATSVKVGYRQASYKKKAQQRCWAFFVYFFITFLSFGLEKGASSRRLLLGAMKPLFSYTQRRSSCLPRASLAAHLSPF